MTEFCVISILDDGRQISATGIYSRRAVLEHISQRRAAQSNRYAGFLAVGTNAHSGCDVSYYDAEGKLIDSHLLDVEMASDKTVRYESVTLPAVRAARVAGIELPALPEREGVRATVRIGARVDYSVAHETREACEQVIARAYPGEDIPEEDGIPEPDENCTGTGP